MDIHCSGCGRGLDGQRWRRVSLVWVGVVLAVTLADNPQFSALEADDPPEASAVRIAARPLKHP